MTNDRPEIINILPEMNRPKTRPVKSLLPGCVRMDTPAPVEGRLSTLANFSPGDIS